MGRSRYEVLITNAAGTTILTDPIGHADPVTNTPGHSRIELKPRHNEAGFGELQVSAVPWILSAVQTPDARLVVRRTDEPSGQVAVEFSGPIEAPENAYNIETDGTDGYGTVKVKCTDDRVWCGYRLVYPNPAQAATAQTSAKYAIAAVNPETAMYALANLNLGPGALAARRLTGLTMAAGASLLPGVTVSASFTRDTILSDALREVSRLAGGAGLGYRIVQTSSGMQFQVFKPQDLTASVVFSRPMGNIRELTYAASAPTATVAVVGDATAGIGRVIKERINTGAHSSGWARREVFVDARGAANAGELDQAGDEALKEQGPQTRFSARVIETPQLRYGFDYPLGAQVSVQPYGGGPFVSALVLGADITVTPDRGEVVEPIVGTDNDLLADAKAAEIRKLWRTIGRLQGAL
ncbi:siphovirus ReqiPepy6 Gp37-like family protein [Actinoplanes sp. NBRC 101535]|uniref:siphovirus ReqiPepy6 Gp37-like family protein n=1 Tax=Actinoplanes sp. NBRC 101535 TaxID=3032196 RepID=UPI0024A45BD1|nr:siphovirus ReqiPepy6 Gp37-like family protein [Actinoplanes sp. NBRC 101535]GLY08276.1 hypothetical protein Acsp01_86550 [Actinoplanes sp. NBRC 101535]